MGTFSVAVQVGSTASGSWEWVEALVDTGASYSWIPEPLLRELGVEPQRKFPFILAAGRRIEKDMAEVRLRYDGEEVTTLVIFGDAGTGALLGAYGLEGLAWRPIP